MDAVTKPIAAEGRKTSITYHDLLKEYKKHLTETDRASLFPNSKTALTIYLRVNQLGYSSVVGVELTKNFSHTLAVFTESQRQDGIKPTTYGPRQSHLRSLQSFYITVVAPKLDVSSFSDVLHGLIVDASHGMISFHRTFLRGRVTTTAFKDWYYGRHLPSAGKIDVVKEIERDLGVVEGTLVRLLPPQRYGRPRRPKGQTTYGRRARAAQKKPYRYWNDALEAEFAEIVRYKSSPLPADGERHSKRERWSSTEGAHLPTARVHKAFFMNFFGFCRLPADASDPYLRGLGIPTEELSLALLADKEVMEAFLEFTRFRTTLGADRPAAAHGPEQSDAGAAEVNEGKYNQSVLSFLGIASSHLREKTGYLYRHPEFSDKLGSRMTAPTWQKQCSDTRRRLMEIHNTIYEMKCSGDEEHYEMGRNPEEPIREILGQKRPLLVIQEMIRTMLQEFELGNRNLLNRALLYRDILLIALLAANPLRIRQFSIMQFDKHLVRKDDGSWWLFFRKGDFKNRQALDSHYCVRIAPEVWPMIDRYRREFHPVLRGGEQTNYVFIAGTTGKHRKAKERSLPAKALSDLVERITHAFVPDSPGFGPHAFRHIVATDIIKSDPRFGFFLASKALHDKLDTVEKAYIHLKTSEYFEPYNEHFGAAWQQVFTPQSMAA
jgi:integrase